MGTLQNSVRLIGHLGRDPEELNLQGNNRGSKFSIATNEYYKDADGVLQKRTQWHNVVAWGNLANNVQNLLHKGDKVAVEGQLRHRKTEDKAGNTRIYTEVHLMNFELMSKSEKEAGTEEAAPF